MWECLESICSASNLPLPFLLPHVRGHLSSPLLTLCFCILPWLPEHCPTCSGTTELQALLSCCVPWVGVGVNYNTLGWGKHLRWVFLWNDSWSLLVAAFPGGQVLPRLLAEDCTKSLGKSGYQVMASKSYQVRTASGWCCCLVWEAS